MRTIFSKIENEKIQLVQNEVYCDLQESDLRDLDEQEKEEILTKRIQQERQKKFSDSLPLWRLTTCRLHDDVTSVSFTFHHAILDGWSVAYFLRSLAATYEALIGKPRLPELISTPLKFNTHVAHDHAAVNSSAKEIMISFKISCLDFM